MSGIMPRATEVIEWRRSTASMPTKCWRPSVIPEAMSRVSTTAGSSNVGIAAPEAELLEVPYYHVVFTVPADIAYHNKAEV